MSELPKTREGAIALLRKLGWNTNELSPDERQAIRKLYGLEPVPLPPGARYIDREKKPDQDTEGGDT
jgi:hypothetical protein